MQRDRKRDRERGANTTNERERGYERNSERVTGRKKERKSLRDSGIDRQSKTERIRKKNHKIQRNIFINEGRNRDDRGINIFHTVKLESRIVKRNSEQK